MRSRMYFLDHVKLAEITNSTPRKIKEMCERGELVYAKWGQDYLIPTAFLRRKFAHLPDYFWKEIVEDLYKEWDGRTSAKIRLERRDQGKDPSTGEPVTPATKK